MVTDLIDAGSTWMYDAPLSSYIYDFPPLTCTLHILYIVPNTLIDGLSLIIYAPINVF